MSRTGVYDEKYGFIPDDDIVPENPQTTNRDRFQAMSNEEMADFLSDHEFALFGMWAKPSFILDWLTSTDWNGYMRTAEKEKWGVKEGEG